MPKQQTRNGGRYSIGSDKAGNAWEFWEQVDPSALVKAIAALSQAGTSITFSTTRNGNTVCVMLMDDGVKYPAYCGSVEELETVLETVTLQAKANL